MAAASPAAIHLLLTYEQYLEEFLTEPITCDRYDIVDGVRIMSPSPRPLHQLITDQFTILFWQQRKTGMKARSISAPLDVLIRERPLKVRQPDVLLMSDSRFTQNGGRRARRPLRIAPELVVEILSDSDRRQVVGDKIADYQSIGLEECWIVRPEAEAVEVLALTKQSRHSVGTFGKGEIIQSLCFPELKIEVESIFED